MDGLLAIDKPLDLTSRDALDRAMAWFPRKTRVGHTGTLDPLATGVLVACIGWTTRLAEYVQAMAKEYVAAVRFGARSATDDAEGPIEPIPDATLPTEAALLAALAEFVGVIEQIPPPYSAAKVAGRRAYALARKGQDVKLEPRPVRIDRIDLVRFDGTVAALRIGCGKGTYIRSLARDLGERLGCGAYLESLRRTRVGPFRVEQAVSLDASSEIARAALVPPLAALADLPQRVLTPAVMRTFFKGRPEPWNDAELPQDAEVALVDERGALRAIGLYDAAQACMRPAKVLDKGEFAE